MIGSSKKITTNDIHHFFYFVDINNLPSILDNGLLSRTEVTRRNLLRHENDISNHSVQALRNKNVEVLGREDHPFLPDYVPLYIQPLNHMLLTVKKQTLCVLVLSRDVLKIHGTFLSSRNAACCAAKFFIPEKWCLKGGMADAFVSPGYHNNDSLGAEDVKKVRQAEILVPGSVPVNYIKHIIVADFMGATDVSGLLYHRSYQPNIVRMPDLFSNSAQIDLLNYRFKSIASDTSVHLCSIFTNSTNRSVTPSALKRKSDGESLTTKRLKAAVGNQAKISYFYSNVIKPEVKETNISQETQLKENIQPEV